MKNKCRTSPKNTHCGPQVIQGGSHELNCAAFDACLGLGRRISYNGKCFTLLEDVVTPDGWYDRIQVVNGCIVAVGQAEEAIYTPPPCAPSPESCVTGTSGGAFSCSDIISAKAGNLSTCSGNKILTTIHFGGGNVTVTGTGTSNDPIVLSAPSGGGSTVLSSNTLDITGEGSLQDPYLINLKQTTVTPGSYLGFEVDSYGRIVNYEAEEQDVVRSVVQGTGITAENNLGAVTIGLADSGVDAGNYQLGGYTVKIDMTGRTTEVKRSVTLEQQTLAVGGKQITVSEFGSITAIKDVPPDTTGFATTFTAVFRAGVSDDEREMSVTMPMDGNLYVEYLGALPGASSGISTEGMALRPNGVTITVDGIIVPDLIVTTGASGKVLGVRGTTSNAMAAGTHTVVIRSNGVTTTDAFMKVELVGRGG